MKKWSSSSTVMVEQTVKSGKEKTPSKCSRKPWSENRRSRKRLSMTIVVRYTCVTIERSWQHRYQ